MSIPNSPYLKKIKLFYDGASRSALEKYGPDPLIAGFTTNPTLMNKAGVTDFKARCKDLLSLSKDKPISFEVFSDDIGEMDRQAREISSWGKNVYTKIPITNSEGKSTIPLIKDLSHSGIKLNVTAMFTPEQSRKTCDALAGGAPAIISIFAGRISDTGRDTLPIMQDALEVKKSHSNIELLWASCRELYNIVQAEQVGCEIITVPEGILNKLKMINKDLNELSLDTVKMFKRDAESSGFSL